MTVKKRRTVLHDTLGERLRKARENTPYTQKDIADRFGISEQAVSHWERDTARPDIEKLSRLAGLYGIPEGRLLGADIIDNEAIARGRRLPVINRIQSGGWEEVAEPSGEEETYVIVEDGHSVSTQAFALEVVGESNAPEYRSGDIVVIDPVIEPMPGDMVAAKLEDAARATFKRYRPKGRDNRGNPIIDLVPLNPDWPTLRIDAEHPGEILGVMVEHRRYRQRKDQGFRSA